MKPEQVVTTFMFYMFNVWCKDESIMLFGENLGTHVWNKWCGYEGRELLFYANLDQQRRSKIVARAIEYYNH